MTSGTLLVSLPSQDADPVFARTVVLLVDHEPSGITSGIAINRPLDQKVVDSSALALMFVPEPNARAFWGGPMGSDPAILAQFSSVVDLDWFHLPIRQRRPFPLPDIGVVAVAEHSGPFEDRILRARLFIGLCVWGRGQLESELECGSWLQTHATTDDIFASQPESLWSDLLARATGGQTHADR